MPATSSKHTIQPRDRNAVQYRKKPLMSVIQNTVKKTPRRASLNLVTIASALIAVGIVALVLVLTGGGRSGQAVASHGAPRYHPLIQYRGTGAPPVTSNAEATVSHVGATLDPETGQMHGRAVLSPGSRVQTHSTAPASLIPRKSYGAVP